MFASIIFFTVTQTVKYFTNLAQKCQKHKSGLYRILQKSAGELEISLCSCSQSQSSLALYSSKELLCLLFFEYATCTLPKQEPFVFSAPVFPLAVCLQPFFSLPKRWAFNQNQYDSKISE